VYFHRRLVEARMPFAGVIVNKVHYEETIGDPDDDFERDLAEALGDDELARRVASNFADYRALSARDRRNVAQLAAEMRTKAVIEVPYLDTDVHDLDGLLEINRYLFASGAEERTAIAAGAG
jgi:anion-transporting  ArsA/GET3 family ATPase